MSFIVQYIKALCLNKIKCLNIALCVSLTVTCYSERLSFCPFLEASIFGLSLIDVSSDGEESLICFNTWQWLTNRVTALTI